MDNQQFRNRWTLAMVVVGLLAGWGCTPPGPEPDDTYIPNFIAVFAAKNDATHTFFFDVNSTSTTGKGTFGSSANEQYKGQFYTVTGTYSHHDLTFTSDRLVNGSKAGFTGKFTDDNTNNTITLQTPEGAITVVRQGQ